MELSHLLVLDHLIQAGDERTPAHLARIFHLSKAAMSNTLTRLEAAGFVHVRPDWEDARRKLVTTSPAGAKAASRAFA
ncbi:MAG: MarR family transcriptional regulator, partial [Pseudomonadota bacterium]